MITISPSSVEGVVLLYIVAIHAVLEGHSLIHEPMQAARLVVCKVKSPSVYKVNGGNSAMY